MSAPEASADPGEAVPAELEPMLAEFRRHFPNGDQGLLVRAYDTACRAHEGQFRRTGDPYITHPLEVGDILAVA